MKCYPDAVKGKDVEAVGTCVLCGMAVCLQHAIRQEIPVFEANFLYSGVTKYPRLLCPECAKALKLIP